MIEIKFKRGIEKVEASVKVSFLFVFKLRVMKASLYLKGICAIERLAS